MNEERRRDIALGRLEQKAHQRYPREHMGLIGTSAVSCCPGPHVGVAEREVPKGILRVSYRHSAWEYELNGRRTSRKAALAEMRAE